MDVVVRRLAFVRDRVTPLFGPKWAGYLHEFAWFGLKELAACVFAGSFLFLLLISSYIQIPGLARYDFLFLGAIVIQLALITARLETWREVAVLSLFHAIGMKLELFKTSPGVGSWSYPEAAFFKIGTVPLYSGFMHAAVASYLMLAWSILDVRVSRFPNLTVAVLLSGAIYANFFTNHYIMDMRWVLAAAVLVLFWRARVHFTALT